jgi:hypothetical protein
MGDRIGDNMRISILKKIKSWHPLIKNAQLYTSVMLMDYSLKHVQHEDYISIMLYLNKYIMISPLGLFNHSDMKLLSQSFIRDLAKMVMPIYNPIYRYYYQSIEALQLLQISPSASIGMFFTYMFIEACWNRSLKNAIHLYAVNVPVNIPIKDTLNILHHEYSETIFQQPASDIQKHDIIFYDKYYQIENNLNRLSDFFNIPYIFQGLLECITRLNRGGQCILYLGTVIHKPIADIHIIMSRYFKTSRLYQPEIYNHIKRDGVSGVYHDFQGIPQADLDALIAIKRKLEQMYPRGHHDFSMSDPKFLKELDIPLPDKPATCKYVNGFLDTSITSPIYDDIRRFNGVKYAARYAEYCILDQYIDKDLTAIKLPTKEQVMTGIMYCKKWDIEYYDIFNKSLFTSAYANTLLADIYGLHEPIIYKFKTAQSEYHGAKKTLRLTQNRHISVRRSIKKRASSRRVTISLDSDIVKLMGSVGDISGASIIDDITAETSIFTAKQGIMAELEPINVNIDAATRLIDTRRDFGARDESLQNVLWHRVNVMFRQYKHKDNVDREHLDMRVSKILKDNTITQAWLKMYEMLVECDLISRTHGGVYRTFHLCELPGSFISAINTYIHSKTRYTELEWRAQSLKPVSKGIIGDQKEILKRHRDRYDFGVDGTGDITHIANIRGYKQYTRSVNMITSDCGLDMKTPGLSRVEYASMVAILYLLPAGGHFVYKILTPIVERFLVNLVYICYSQFKELIFYKPVQNQHSREYYIVGKSYTPLAPDIIEMLMGNIERIPAHMTQEVDIGLDIFRDRYPGEFVRQFVKGYRAIADNCTQVYKRHIFYVDHYEELPREFFELIERYYKEKNADWIRKYELKRIPEQHKL